MRRIDIALEPFEPVREEYRGFSGIRSSVPALSADAAAVVASLERAGWRVEGSSESVLHVGFADSSDPVVAQALLPLC